MVVVVTNISSGTLGFRELKLPSGDNIRLAPTQSSQVSDFFTPEDISECDTLRTAFEAAKVTITIDAVAITEWSELIESATANTVEITGTVQSTPKVDSSSKVTVSTSFVNVTLAATTEIANVINYADQPVEIVYDTNTAAPITLPAASYTGSNVISLPDAGPLNVSGLAKLQVKALAAPTAGKNYVIVIQTESV